MDNKPISIRVPTDILELLDKVAEVTERDRTWVFIRAFKKYLEAEGGDILYDAEGMEASRREGVYDFDETMQELKNMLKDDNRLAG